jgi:hypothetical protein
LGLAVAALQPATAQVSGVKYIYHPGPGPDDAYKIAQAYPGTSLPHQFPSPLGRIYDNKRWTGPDLQSMEDNIKAVPGIFALETAKEGSPPRDTFKLNTMAFATCNSDPAKGPVEISPIVQSVRMRKIVPGSIKCPIQYATNSFYMFGRSIRTWWTLNYTQPGTRFVLEVTVRCLDLLTRVPRIHIDRYTWEVVADFDTLLNTINVLHSNAISTMEVPCIMGEDLYAMLINQVEIIRAAYNRPILDPDRLFDAQNALFEMEALILSSTAFGDYVEKDLWFPSGPPSNLTSDHVTPFGLCGILDTTENPCGCKLLVDVEFIGVRLGIVTL